MRGFQRPASLTPIDSVSRQSSGPVPANHPNEFLSGHHDVGRPPANTPTCKTHHDAGARKGNVRCSQKR